MITKTLTSGAVLCALALGPANPALADGKDFALGIVTGVVGSAVVRNIKKNQQQPQRNYYVDPAPAPAYGSQTRHSTRSTGPSAALREENRQVQTALNYFSFPAGSPDGVMGSRTRSAVSDYQRYLGYAATGDLAPYERDFLVNSYYRAQSGGAATNQAIAGNPDGVRGLLTTWRAETAGTATAPAAASSAAVPTFLKGDTASLPLSDYCTRVGQQTIANGGTTRSAAFSDADFALSEQFCQSRTAAMAQSRDLMKDVPGYSAQEIADQCRGFGPLLKGYVTALGQQTEPQVIEQVSGWATSSGLPRQELAGTARVCLGTGYASDDLDTAIGSALVLTALGEAGYAEMPGHHLSQGFGTAKRPDLAVGWYDAALAAPAPMFADAGGDRRAVLRKAVGMISGRADAGAGTDAARLPTFATAP